jgi:hypothetical protein
MKRNLLVAAASFAAMASATPAWAQPRPGSSELPIRQVVLFSSGVAYYQREGQVDGQARVDLTFPQECINDMLKSMIVEDRGSKQVATVTYDNLKPVELTLKSFAIDLTRNPSMGDLLNQVRGEQVEILTTVDPRAAVGQTETIAGLVVGVEKQRQPLGKDQFIEVSQLNMLTKEGLRGVPLSQIQRVKFTKAALDGEFRKALEVIATGHDKGKKAVSLNFSGEGKRSVKVGYVAESPIWKTSYRLALVRKKVEKAEAKSDAPKTDVTPKLPKDDVVLQGWAIVENTTDEDWSSVQLGLVSGRPISFQMDLYQPLFVNRPVEQLELFASLRPQTYEGNMLADRDMDDKAAAYGFGGQGKGEGKGAAKEAEQLNRQRLAGAPMADSRMARGIAAQMKRNDNGIGIHKDATTAAVSTELGEYFQYTINQPVNLPRQKSALLPIVNQEVKGTRVSIYNENVHKKFPLLGLQFQNTTPLHLTQGPVTVFDDSTYAGDAKIADLQPNDKRLISYAIDLGTEVDPQFKDSEDLLKVKVYKGTIIQDFMRKEKKTYKILNRSEHARTLLVEHPIRPQFNLIAPAKPKEQARNAYRFEVVCESKKPTELLVEEHLPRQSQVTFSNSSDESIRLLFRSSVMTDKVKTALEKAMGLRATVSDAQLAVRREQKLLADIERDQNRMRQNLAQVPPSSEAYKKYVKKFDEQEEQIDALRKKIAQLDDKRDAAQQQLDNYLASLEVE